MVVAIATTLALDGISNWGLIVAGGLIGSIVGVVGARTVKMTAMPQMVALFNGGGGGAAALGIALIAGVDEQWVLVGLIVLALVFGVMFVLPIGGADMPVVISLLNAFTGL